MAGKVLDDGNIRAVVAQDGAKRMAQNMRSELLSEAGSGFEVLEETGDVLALQRPHWVARRHEHLGIIVYTTVEILLNP